MCAVSPSFGPSPHPLFRAFRVEALPADWLRRELAADLLQIWHPPDYQRPWLEFLRQAPSVPWVPAEALRGRQYAHLHGDIYAPRTHYPLPGALFKPTTQPGRKRMDPGVGALVAYRIDVGGESGRVVADELGLSSARSRAWQGRIPTWFYDYVNRSRSVLYERGAWPWALAGPSGKLPSDWLDRAEYGRALHAWLWLGVGPAVRWDDPALAGVVAAPQTSPFAGE